MNIKVLKFNINEDLKALNVTRFSKVMSVGDKGNIARFQIYMRVLEFLIDKKSLVILFYLVKYLYVRKSFKLGFSIPIGIFGPGLAIVHKGTIVISGDAKIGSYCRLHAGVNIGKTPEVDGAPIIGNNCYIGPGVKIFGPVVLGDEIKIGANAVVNKSFEQGFVSLVGVPARKVQ